MPSAMPFPEHLDPSFSQNLNELPETSRATVWQPPPEGLVKINWDTGTSVWDKKTGMRVVIHVDVGNLLVAKVFSHPIALQPEVAEAEAALVAVNFAFDLVSENLTAWCGLIREIKGGLRRFGSCQILLVNGNGNGAAQFLAKEALRMVCPKIWIEGPDV